MNNHHTKVKGDLGVLKAKVDLHIKGFTICNPETEHAPFDLVAYKDGKFLRVQVKYRTMTKGVITFSARTNWADKNGTHTRPYNKDELDVICIYCPDTDKCYYLAIKAVDAHFSLRLTPPKNGQVKGINLADDFLEVPF